MDRAVSWIWSTSPRARWISLAVVVVLTLGFAALLRAVGVTHATRFGHDDFIFLDGGYRVLMGQRPHVDFHTPLGLVTPMLVGLAMKIGGPTASAINLATILFVVVTVAWCYAIAARRLAPAFAAAYALLVGAIGIGQYTLSFDYQETSVASIFNRYAYAVLAILLLECAAPITPRDKTRDRIAHALGGASTGAALALLFFLKPSYVAQGAVFLVMSLAMAGRARERWIGAALGVVVTTAALVVVSGTSLSAVLDDYAVGAASRSSGITANDQDSVFVDMSRRDSFSATPAKLLEIVRVDLWSMLALLGLAALVPVPVARVHAKLAGRRGVVALAAIVLVSSIPIVFTNWQWGEIPTTCAFALVLAAVAPPGAADAPSLRATAIAGLVLFLWGSFVPKAYASVVAAWSWHRTYADSPVAQSLRLRAEPVKDLRIMRSDGYCRVPYATRINEGIELLAKLEGDKPRVFVADFSNPFTFALGLPPPRGDAMWWHLGATFSETRYWPAEEVLGEVDVVMVPKCAEEVPTRDAIVKIYGGYLDGGFVKGEESGNWVVMRRR